MAENDQNQEAAQAGQASQDEQPYFALQRFYLKDASFEAPNAPDVFKQSYAPQVNFNLNNRSRKLDDENLYEVGLRLTAEVKQDDKTLFLVEIEQAGIFEIRNLSGERLEQVLNITCPNLLFPYAKEAIESLVVKASFPPLMLNPVNFDVVYNQAKQQRAQEQSSAAPQALNGDGEPTVN